MAKHFNPHTQHGEIHPSFPAQGVPQRAHLGSQSKAPRGMAEGSPKEEASESPAFERKEDGAAY